MLYRTQGRYADAEPLYKRALAIREKALGPDHPDVATSLNNLASFTAIKAAMPTPSRSTSARWRSARKRSVPIIPMSQQSLNNLATLYRASGPLCRGRAALQALAGDPREGARSRSSRCRDALNNLAVLYEQGRYADAEPLYKRALAIYEKALGPDHPDVATVAEQSGGALR